VTDEDDFSETRTGVFEAHSGGRFDEGLRITREGKERHFGRLALLTYWETCFTSMLGRPDDALSLLRAGLDEGMWWAPEWLLTDPDLDAVRHLQGFGGVEAESRRRCREANRQRSAPALALRMPEGLPPFPLLLVLHVGRETEAERGSWWFPAADSGVAVALVGSPQRESSDADADRSWVDPELTAEDIGTGIATASEELGAPKGVILAGFSINGRVAAQFALRGTPVSARGFIAIGPAPFDPRGQPLDEAARRGVRSSLIVGSEDRIRTSVSDLRDALQDAGIPVRYDEVPGAAHEIPSDFGHRLTDAIAFVLALA
jgi:hypothetical protein